MCSLLLPKVAAVGAAVAAQVLMPMARAVQVTMVTGWVVVPMPAAPEGVAPAEGRGGRSTSCACSREQPEEELHFLKEHC